MKSGRISRLKWTIIISVTVAVVSIFLFLRNQGLSITDLRRVSEVDRQNIDNMEPVHDVAGIEKADSRDTSSHTGEKSIDSKSANPGIDAVSDVGNSLSSITKLKRDAEQVAEFTTPLEKEGLFTRVSIIRTKEKYPLIRIEESIRRHPASGIETVESQVGMVADHVLVQFITNGEHEQSVFVDQLRDVGFQNAEPVNDTGLWRVSIPFSRSSDYYHDSIEKLENEPSGIIEYAEPDYLRFATAMTPDDPYFKDGTLWALEEGNSSGIDAPEGWEIIFNTNDIIVAVIDTGIRLSHEDLDDNLWVNTIETAGNGIDDDLNGYIDDIHGIDFVNNDSDPTDDHGHGTHVAGIIGAEGNNGTGVTGVAWDVQIMSIKYLSSEGYGYNSDLLQSIDYAISNGAHIVNASYGGRGHSLTEKRAIERMRDAGMMLIAAAGNESSDTDRNPHYPSSYNVSNIVSVAATDSSDKLAPFSNYGQSSVDLG